MNPPEEPIHTFGFTGTQQGMSLVQTAFLTRLLTMFYNKDVYPLQWFRHGACKGADTQAHWIARKIGYLVGLHPCNIAHKSTVTNLVKSDTYNELHPIEDPLVRNRIIVESSTVMIATPSSAEPQQRSGTWYTIRHAIEVKKPLIILFPDGSYDEVNL